MSTPPIPYNRQADFTAFSTEQFPTVGQDLEAEFNKIDQSLDQTQDRLAEIQRDDGLLKNLSVHPDALGEAVRALLGADAGTPKGNWQTGLIYNPKDVAMFGGVSYLAAVEHVAGADFNTDLAAGKWLPLSGANDGGSLRVDLASTVAGKGAALVRYDSDETVKDRLDTLGNLRADLANPGAGLGADLVQLNVAESVADRLNSLAGSGGSTLISYIQAGTGAVARSMQDRLRDRVSVFDFLTDAQKADVRARAFAQDVTAGVQACIDYATTNGRAVYFPGGGYLVGKLTIRGGSHLVGESVFKTELRLKAGTNDNLVYGEGSDALWGTNTDAGIRLFSISQMTLNGNRANNTVGSCIAVYGRSYIVRDVKIVNAPEHGMRTEYYSFGGATPGDFGMESHFENVSIDTSGKHGWLNRGPHDSVAINIIIIDSSQTTDNTYDNFRNETTARFYGCHGWTRGTTPNLPRHSCADTIGGCEYTNCHFEGTKSAPLLAGGQRATFTDCVVYAAKGGKTVLIKAPGVRFSGYLLGKADAGAPATVGFTLGENVGDNVNNCIINASADLQDGGVVDFTNSQGNNHLTIRGFNPSGATSVGSPASSDFCDVSIIGASGINIQQQYPTRFRTGINMYSAQSGITAAGSNQASATALTSTFNNVTNVAASTGVRLPDDASSVGALVWVHNFGANSLNVYPDSGSRINANAFDAAVSIATNKGSAFYCVALGQWIQLAGA